MKAIALLSIFALTLVQGTVDFKPKVGQKLRYAAHLSLDIGGNEATVDSTIDTEVKKSDDKVIEITGKWSDLKIAVGGNEIDANASDSTAEFDPSGKPIMIRGGIEGSDAVQQLLVTLFIPPMGKELTPGMKYTVDVPAVKDEIPAFKYEGEYVGKETLDGKTVHRFKAVGTVAGEGGMKTTQTILVKEDGVTQKVEAEFKGMDVPAAGAKADGKATLTLK
ncbi:MAG TPA: hypothetical protein VK934_01625 [Fimbriimonas sp.]|nr:hypothetical protein [Fimbriimonas sp.]